MFFLEHCYCFVFFVVFLCFCTRQVFYRATLFSLLLTRSSHFISVDGYLLLLFSTILCLFRYYFKLIFHICDPIFASFYIKNLLSSIPKIYISEIVERERENRFEGYNLIKIYSSIILLTNTLCFCFVSGRTMRL